MPNLDPLAMEVNSLSRTESDDFAFIDALDHIEEAGRTTDNEIDALRNILDRYRSKLPNRETLDAQRVRAKDLADALMLNTLAKRIERIRARNEALSSLTATLRAEIARANSDANRLKQIRDAVDQATKTVAEVKALINGLTATDGGVKQTLTMLIERLGNISTIFSPA